MLRVLAAAALLAAPTSAAVSWPAPKNPMALARAAGLVPEVNEHLTYHVHSHLDVFVSGKRVRVPAGIGINIADPAVKSVPDAGRIDCVRRHRQMQAGLHLAAAHA